MLQSLSTICTLSPTTLEEWEEATVNFVIIIKHINYSMRNPRVLCNIQATRPRACACIFHKTLGLMLYLLHVHDILLTVVCLQTLPMPRTRTTRSGITLMIVTSQKPPRIVSWYVPTHTLHTHHSHTTHHTHTTHTHYTQSSAAYVLFYRRRDDQSRPTRRSILDRSLSQSFAEEDRELKAKYQREKEDQESRSRSESEVCVWGGGAGCVVCVVCRGQDVCVWGVYVGGGGGVWGVCVCVCGVCVGGRGVCGGVCPTTTWDF